MGDKGGNTILKKIGIRVGFEKILKIKWEKGYIKFCVCVKMQW